MEIPNDRSNLPFRTMLVDLVLVLLPIAIFRTVGGVSDSADQSWYSTILLALDLRMHRSEYVEALRWNMERIPNGSWSDPSGSAAYGGQHPARTGDQGSGVPSVCGRFA